MALYKHIGELGVKMRILENESDQKLREEKSKLQTKIDALDLEIHAQREHIAELEGKIEDISAKKSKITTPGAVIEFGNKWECHISDEVEIYNPGNINITFGEHTVELNASENATITMTGDTVLITSSPWDVI